MRKENERERGRESRIGYVIAPCNTNKRTDHGSYEKKKTFWSWTYTNREKFEKGVSCLGAAPPVIWERVMRGGARRVGGALPRGKLFICKGCVLGRGGGKREAEYGLSLRAVM